MKATFITILAILAIAFTSCTNNASTSAETTNQDSTTVQVDTLNTADTTAKCTNCN